MSEFTRPKGFQFAFGGINLRTSPESIQPTQYASALNIRADSPASIRTRPGYTSVCTAAAGKPILAVRAYSTLGTDDLPRFLMYDSFGHVVLDTGTTIATLASPFGSGACLLPFRPNQSPQSWMYISTLGDYQKFAAPDALNAVSYAKVGIAEPPSQLEYAPTAPLYTDISGVDHTAWAPEGTAGVTSDAVRSTDTTTAIYPDPVISTRYSVQVASTIPYQAGELLVFTKAAGGTIQAIVQAVIPPIPTGAGLVINAIRYAAGTSGRCTIVPSQIPTSSLSSGSSYIQSLMTEPIGPLQRGSLITLKATETMLVLDVTNGPDGSQCFECVTVGTFAAGDSIDGVPAIIVDGITSGVVGQNVASSAVSSAIALGIGYLQSSVNPFNAQLASSGKLPQADDYIHLSLYISDYTLVTEIKIMFDIDTTTHDFQHNAFYYSISAGPLAQIAANKSTQSQIVSTTDQVSALDQAITTIQGLLSSGNYFPLIQQFGSVDAARAELAQLQAAAATANPVAAAASALEALAQTTSGYAQWTEVLFPISALTRIGGDPSRTLANCDLAAVQVNCTAGVTLKIGSFWIGGGGQPDTGDSNADYCYRAVPRATTGAKGNATPTPRYGVRPRRQSVTLDLPSSAYDTQIAYWDIYRYGGTITSWRYIGSALSSASTFTDNYFDSAANAGDPLELDNFEPWPSVDVPFSVSSGGGTTITAVGTFVTIAGNATWPSSIGSWLPGTLITLNGQSTYTLRARPTYISSTSYFFELVECANFGSLTSFTVNEPLVARQLVPYTWGPNSLGHTFAVGDPLRPGSVYFCKPNNPDSAPDANNIELCPPSEPLIGGEVLKGVSLVASTKRWWALYPSFSYTAAYQGATQNSQYTPIEQPIGRPLISPYGHCSDGQMLFFWTKDGIAATEGGPSKSLTDEALYTLFPHEGVSGANITRNGVTYYAPDYKRAATFRLSVANKILYADYQDSTGSPRTLVLNLATGAWSTDVYHDAISLHYFAEQQSGTLLVSTTLYTAVVLADTSGKLWKQADLHNDNLTPIVGSLATFEWDGSDQRGNDLWGDLYLISIPNSAITATPMYLGASANTATVIAASASRAFSTISMSGGALLNYLGLQLDWTDDFTLITGISAPTQLFFWQPSLISQVETTTDRMGDWDDSKALGNKFYQGLVLDADTFNLAKSVKIRDADALVLHTLQPTTIQHNGRSIQAYTFPTPFTAHSVRYEPQDLVPWRLFKIEFVFEPTPELGTTWETQFTAHGISGFHHIGRIEAAYSALAAVTLVITSFDGTSPATLTLPSTAGVYERIILSPTFNKGQLYKYRATSAQPFQIYLNDFIIHVGAWGRSTPYTQYRLLGDQFGDKAQV